MTCYKVLPYLLPRSNDESIIEELTKVYWHAINTLGPLFDPFIESLVDMLCQCYDKNQYACLLESSAQVSRVNLSLQFG